jgi:hypothetical protein
MTHVESLVERLRKQSAAAGISPERLLLDELLDMQRLYVLGLEMLSRESRNGNAANSTLSAVDNAGKSSDQ